MQNVKSFFIYYFLPSFAVLCIISANGNILSCENSTQKAGTAVANNVVEQITLNNEIQGLQRQIEALESKVFKLDSANTVLDSLRIKNIYDSPNKSNAQHFGELSKRYPKKRSD